jgi:uncharacterized protein YggE
MKNTFLSILVFFILLFAYTKLAGPLPFSVTSTTTTKSDSFTVTGEGKATFLPDIAVVSAGVTAQGASVQQVQKELNTKINAVSEAVKKLGVDGKDIQTTNYSINPSYDYTNGTQKITGFQANTTLTIKIRTLDKTNSVIDTATANGANQIGGISFDVDDKTKAEDEARGKAVAEAKKKAAMAAKTAGFTLGKIINYSEGFGGYPQPIRMYAKTDAVGAGVPETTQIEPGSGEVTIQVSLSYELR